MSGVTDEEKFGFSYNSLNAYLRHVEKVKNNEESDFVITNEEEHVKILNMIKSDWKKGIINLPSPLDYV